MHYRRLGRSGLKISELSYGAWVTFGNQIDQKTASNLVHAAYDKGVNFFDNSDAYADGAAEKVMGKAVKDLPRQALVLSSKVFWPTFPGPNGRGLSRKHLTESLHASLTNMDVDYLDLYFCHRYDPDTPIEEIVYTMNSFIQQGKILYWGTSEWRASHIAEAYGIARQYGLIPPTMEQPQYNMFSRHRVESELSPLRQQMGIGLTIWSPLASGILTGKYNDGIPEGSRASLEDMGYIRDRITDDKIAKVRKLSAVAQDLGISVAQLAIAWTLRRKEVSSVITGATSLKQLEENLSSRDVLHLLDDDLLQAIESILDNHPED
jgi:voltage-dependent potassium channel beta subunit